MNHRKAVFFDRDGVLNRRQAIHDYVKNIVEFEWNNGAIDLICRIRQKGFLVIVVTNQRGVALGRYSREFVEMLHRRMNDDLRDWGTEIDAFYVCYHDYGDNCNCRKPKPGLLIKAQFDHDIDFSESYLIGDSKSDIDAGREVGCKGVILIESDQIEVEKLDKLIV